MTAELTHVCHFRWSILAACIFIDEVYYSQQLDAYIKCILSMILVRNKTEKQCVALSHETIDIP
jgi:hypothetical protein